MLKNEQQANKSIAAIASFMVSEQAKKANPATFSAAMAPLIAQAHVFALLAIAEAIYESGADAALTEISKSLDSIATELGGIAVALEERLS